MFIREKGQAKKGQWWVRTGDSNALAGPEDYIRVLQKTLTREVGPLRAQVEALRMLEKPEETGGQTKPTISLADQIRSQHKTPEDHLRQGLYREYHNFTLAFEDEFLSPNLEQNDEQRGELLQRLEEMTTPLGQALTAATELGNGLYDEATAEILLNLSAKTLRWPASARTLDHLTEFMRAYPQVLITFGVCAAAIAANRITWLKPMLERTVPSIFASPGGNLLEPTRTLAEWYSRAELPLLASYGCAPEYRRVTEVALRWLDSPRTTEQERMLIAHTELLQSLLYIHMKDYQEASAIPNTLIYTKDANVLIQVLLKRYHDVKTITDLFGNWSRFQGILQHYIKDVSRYNYQTQYVRCWPYVSEKALEGL